MSDGIGSWQNADVERKRKVPVPDGQPGSSLDVGMRVSRSGEPTAHPQEAHRGPVVVWAEAALGHASLQDIEDPPGVVATVAGLTGVWAHGADVREAREELLEVLVDWASLKIEHGDDDIPSIDGVSLYVTQ